MRVPSFIRLVLAIIGISAILVIQNMSTPDFPADSGHTTVVARAVLTGTIAGPAE